VKTGHDGADAFNQVLILLSAGQAFLAKIDSLWPEKTVQSTE